MNSTTLSMVRARGWTLCLLIATLAPVLQSAPALAEDAAARREQAQVVFDRAKSLAGAEQYDAAALLFEESFKMDASWAKPLVNAALCRRRAGDFAAAKKTYRRVLKTFPDEPSALFGLAETERLDGNRKAARELFLRYLVVENRKGQEKLIDYASRQVGALKEGGPSPAPRVAQKPPPPAAQKEPPAKKPRAAAPPPAPVNKPRPIVVQQRPATGKGPASKGPGALDHQTLLVLDPVASGVSRQFVNTYNRILKEELVKAGGLSVHHPDEAIGRLVKNGQPQCKPQPTCLAPVMGAGVMLESTLRSERDRVRITLRMLRTQDNAKIGEVSGTVQGKAAVTRFVREALSDLLAQHALAQNNAPAKPAEPARGEHPPHEAERRVAQGKRDVADAEAEPGPAKKRRRLVTDDQPTESKIKPKAEVAEAQGDAPDEPISGTTVAKHAWRWGFVAVGVSVAGAGLFADVLLPTSANYKLDAADFILPGAIASGVALGLVGFFINPFSWLE